LAWTNDKLFIQGLSSISKVSIYNVLGKLVLSQTISKEIDVNNLQSGIYIIKIVDEQKEFDKNHISSTFHNKSDYVMSVD
jgi:hypothetical protein